MLNKARKMLGRIAAIAVALLMFLVGLEVEASPFKYTMHEEVFAYDSTRVPLIFDRDHPWAGALYGSATGHIIHPTRIPHAQKTFTTFR